MDNFHNLLSLRPVVKRTLFLISFIALLSCKKDNSVEPASTIDLEIMAWLDTMNINAERDESGIYYYPEIQNTGGASTFDGSVVSIYYELSDLDGNVIASHQRVDGDSLSFKLGASAVYPVGVDIAVSLMRVGETYNFILPPDQAYGELTSGAIDSTLIARLSIELVNVEIEDNIFANEVIAVDSYIDRYYLDSLEINPIDSTIFFPAAGITTKRLSAGIGPIPLNGDTIILDFFTYELDSTNINSRNGLQFYFGSDNPAALIPGFEFGVSMMQRGERALLMIPSSQAYRESALVIPAYISDDLVADAIIPDYVVRVAPYTTLLFEVTRLN